MTMTKLKHTTLAAAAVGVAALAGGTSVSAAVVPAIPMAGVYAPADQPALQKAQFLFGGRNYCFYDDAWNGPGFYYCGYAWQRGYGWGGPEGWHGWNRGGYRGGGAGYYRGGGYNRGGGWGGHGGNHGGGHAHGGGHGGDHGGGHGGHHDDR
jgi:hypothetical protein